MKGPSRSLRCPSTSSRIPDLETVVKDFLSQRRFLLPTSQSKFLVLYSGGADSSVLFHCLLRISLHPERIQALHIDYGLRGEESAQEARGITRVCLRKKIILHRYSHSLSHLKEEPGNLQSEARKFRYRKAVEIARDWGGDVHIVTAHHRDDFLETFFSKLLKGQSPASLASVMKESTSIMGVPVLRPLSRIPKSDLMAYAKKNRIRFFTDSSNAENTYERNYLRNRVFPLLDKKFLSWRDNVIRSISLLDQADRFMEDMVQPWIRDLPPFPPAGGEDRNFSGFILTPDFFELPREKKEYLFHRELYRHFPDRRFSMAEILSIIDKIADKNKVGEKDKVLFTLSDNNNTEVVWSRGWVAPLMTFSDFSQEMAPDLLIEIAFSQVSKSSKNKLILGFSFPGRIILDPPQLNIPNFTLTLPSFKSAGGKTDEYSLRPLSEYRKSLKLGNKTLKKHIEGEKLPAPIRSSLLGITHNQELIGIIDLWNYNGRGGFIGGVGGS